MVDFKQKKINNKKIEEVIMFLTENAMKVLEKRYLAKDINGKLLEDVD